MFFGQHNEDQTLLELMEDFTDRGFYIDVGAWDPDESSVTKYFYTRGWSGINIEPADVAFRRLTEERPRDINLQCAVGAFAGTRRIYYVDVAPGLSTLVARIAEPAFARYGGHESTVDVRTLADICREYVPAGAKIDFLKIDVEGLEFDVIAGADWHAYRPRLLCIEATEPNTDIPSWRPWDPMLTAVGYKFLRSDGVNRFYGVT